MRILLVEDEARVASFVEQGLREDGYAVTWVIRGEEALSRFHQESFDLVILDLRLPDISGIEVCQKIRITDAQMPILMLTAMDGVADRVQGLRAGADDYLPKPFAFEELLARIEALLRRSLLQDNPHLLTDGKLSLDPASRECTFDGKEVMLTKKEFDLLVYFLARKNQALDREVIHRDVWGHDFDRGTNLIDVYVGYLRKKLKEAECPSGIETARGIGYRYRPAENRES